MAGLLALLVMVPSLLLVPLGVPGLWIMVAAVAVGVLTGHVSALTLAALVVVAGAAELLEFLILKRYATRYGGSRRAFWGAIAGGLLGAFAGIPAPLVGSLVGIVLGTFAGAALVTWLETRELGRSARAGWGSALARAVAAATKTAAGLVLLVVGGGAFFVG